MNQKGLTLIEILLMVALIGLVAAALGQLSVVSIKTADAARSRTTANELAKQATELARSQRDSDPTNFFSLNGYYLIREDNSFEPQSNAACINPPDCSDLRSEYRVPGTAYQTFYREVRIQKDLPTAGQSTVTATVYYQQRGIYDKIILQTKLSNWR